MNERIKELVRQAFIKERKESCPDWKESELSDALLQDFEVVFENFAELIIKECGYYADIFESLGCPVDMDPTETKPSDYIKKHFGVE